MPQRNASLLVGPIKRVIRKNGQFICGICQDEYPQLNHAMDCLHECWNHFQTLVPVVMRRSYVRWMYRCRYCARDYGSFGEATSCSSQCRTGLSQNFDKEWSLFDYTPPQRKKFVPKARPKMAFLAATRPSTQSGASEAREKEITEPDESGPQSNEPIGPIHADATPLGELSTPALAPSTEDSQKSEDKEPKQKKEKDHGFYRDGARYVCDICNAKYFTKEDVMTCFKGHNKT